MRHLKLLLQPLAVAVAVAVCSSQDTAQATPLPTPAVAPAPAAPNPAVVNRIKTPALAKLAFVGIKDGDTVSSPFKVVFAVSGLTVARAGTPQPVSGPPSGHFHLIIDADLPPQGAALPANEHVKHYGKGQVEDTLTLPAGPHTLQLEFADGAHVPFDPPLVSEKITITVK